MRLVGAFHRRLLGGIENPMTLSACRKVACVKTLAVFLFFP